ncbi:MAG TPA: PPC domain-containing protein [Chthoniobacteraceae bacterium]|nr:PPC domain-containing protein [Chthoniobacteraceae bacterium]
MFLLGQNFTRAASPVVSDIDPPGGQRGAEVDVVITGDRLSDAKGILFYEPGIEVSAFDITDPKHIKAKLKLAPDCPLGAHSLRVWTASGVGELHQFSAGPYPTVLANGKNIDIARAQPVALNSTVSGIIKNEEVDYYSVDLKKGQRLTAEVEGMRLGVTLFDPWLGIMDKSGKLLASCDDCALLLEDPLVALIAPADGTYIVQVRESTYGGSDKSKYRLHIGTFPQPTVLYPPGGQAGQELALTFLGDPAGPIEKKITPAAPADGVSRTATLFAEQDNLPAPAANSYRISPFPNVFEVKPNQDIDHATKTDLPLPLAFNGIVSNKGDADYFRFKAKKGDEFDFRVYARALRSPLDSVLALYDAKGKKLASNDDSDGPDSYLRYKFGDDGDYCLSVTDQIGRGGPDFTFRVEVTPVQPLVEISVPEVVKDSQERQAIAIPRGNFGGAVLHIKRADYYGGIVAAFPDLPPGVTAQFAPMPDNADSIPVVFQATPDAAVAGKLCQVAATPADATKKFAFRFEHHVNLVQGPNNVSMYQAQVGALPLAVSQEAPFKVHIIAPKVPIVQNGSMNLKVAIERSGDFKGPVDISLLYRPNGIGSDNTVRISEGQSEGVIALSAGGDAIVRKWKIAVTAAADTGNGQVWICSPFEDLEVAAPYVTATLDRSVVEQGQSATVACHLTFNKQFEGKAKLQLVNLPIKVTAQEMEIGPADENIQIPVAADKTSQVTSRKDLFCVLTIMQNGEAIVENIAQGGIMRVAKAGAPK